MHGEAEPTRVRAAWISDHDITQTVTTYAPSAPAVAGETTTVIDLTDKTRQEPRP